VSAAIDHLLPCAAPVRLVDQAGRAVEVPQDGEVAGRGYGMPAAATLKRLWQAMVLARRLDTQATALTKQGRLAVYPSALGQDACQVAPVLALHEQDWLFPTYRDSMALFTRGIDPVEALTLLRGDWHCGYDPHAHRTAPACTPLATQAVHAAGAAHGMARRAGSAPPRAAALCFVGDGATSEGDFHEALNFAAVFHAPVVFFVQNNTYAISVPLERQTKAPALAYKGVGYGIRSEQVDGNDAAAVFSVTRAALEHARAGKGPVLVEGHTYRVQAHTNADDASRYRQDSEVAQWRERDPVERLQAYLQTRHGLTAGDIDEQVDLAESRATELRQRMQDEPVVDPDELFRHVYAQPTPHLRDQADLVSSESASAP